eukprot:752754-Pelagomonas_calceolata.AAC.2
MHKLAALLHWSLSPSGWAYLKRFSRVLDWSLSPGLLGVKSTSANASGSPKLSPQVLCGGYIMSSCGNPYNIVLCFASR